MPVSDEKSFMELLEKVRSAQRIFSTFSQEKVDEIFRAAALAVNHHRIPLAKLAVQETGYGVVEDKVIKNHFASEYIYNQFKNEKTCGIIERDYAYGYVKVAEPVGVVGAVVPTTNPTSTAAFKALICLKTRNGIIFSPHPRAKNCTIETAKLVLKAAVEAGAPEGIIGWIDEPSVELSNTLMRNVDLILATGGPGMVKAAYSSGTPAIGVGAGNTPVIVDETADMEMVCSYVIMSKSFDNGVICASEQSIHIPDSLYDKYIAEFVKRGAYLFDKGQTDKIRKTIFTEKGTLNAETVGQNPAKIAKMAGFDIPLNARIGLAEAKSVELSEPLAHEKLSTILTVYRYKTFEEALNNADKLVCDGGLGHTSVMYADPQKAKDRINEWMMRMKTGRTLINMPASQGAIGDLFNFKLKPSLTLGCGTWGGNAVSQNVEPRHLLNYKTVVERRENMLWFRVPKKVYFKSGCLPVAMGELASKKRAFIVTDPAMEQFGYLKSVTGPLEEMGVDYRVFSEIEPDPNLACVRKGAELMTSFNPDVVIALGGGSAMDAAKIMWVMYEDPTVNFLDLCMTFMDIRKRIVEYPELGRKADFWAVATSSGTGSEVTPFAVITDEKTGIKYPLADYQLTPTVAIVDPQLTLTMPKSLCAASGYDVLTHATESYVSVVANDYTKPLSKEAITLVMRYLKESYDGGAEALEAKEGMINASCLAGMAFANAFLGINHSLAHKLGAHFHVPHGIANALVMPWVIRYNAVDAPYKMGTFPQYKTPKAKERYAEIADLLGLGGKTIEDKVENYAKACEKLRKQVDMPALIKDFKGIDEAAFVKEVDIMCEEAFNDQCTGANPRYPLIEDLKHLYLIAFYGADDFIKKYGQDVYNRLFVKV
ncbi:MAG: bifunctional acetaldehyde-CoA/alcohol dehydrogenase [Spirochaetia bacterium]